MARVKSTFCIRYYLAAKIDFTRKPILAAPDLVRDLSLVFFVPDLRRIIREGEISRGFLGNGKKSIDLESVVERKL